MSARVPQTGNTAATNDDIVISGISGRLPESDSIGEFKRQLFDGVDLVTDDDRRWPAGMYGVPKRAGKLKNIKNFDATFFGAHPKLADSMDPQVRMLLEVTHEALIDAGINPTEFRGSNTGVYVGVCNGETFDYFQRDIDRLNGYEVMGNARSMFCNRISFSFDLKGPSYAIDSACSSSLLSLHQAVVAIKNGECDAAIVSGVNLLLKPETSLSFNLLNMLSSDGKCKTFDSTRNGFVRAEAVVVVLLQKASVAKRVYATVLGSRTNTDGGKEQGIAFPLGEMQGKLIREVYAEAGVDTAEVTYVEAHGTGTAVGDPQEVNAIVDNFCKDHRKSALMIGSVKSNMGHGEAAAGLCSIAKILIAMESGVIPANLHFEHPNEEIPGLSDGRLKVVSENQPWNGGIVGINSFGFGGSNVHAILSSNPTPKVTRPPGNLPRLITVSGRTKEAVHHFLDKINECDYDAELYALVDGVHTTNIPRHGYRGFSIRGENVKEVSEVGASNRPIWFVFCGMGSQWPGMGKKLMDLEPFRNSIKRSADVLTPYGIDLEEVIVNGDEATLANVRNTFVAIVAIQIALVDILRLLNVEPDGILGHSLGEGASAYADGSLTRRQAVLVAYSRGTAVLETKLVEGAMASVGLNWEECEQRCPPDVYPVCNNSKDNVTISGPPKSVQTFVEKLTKEDIFVRTVKTSGFAFHSRYIADAAPHMRKALDSVISSPKERSPKWISTSVPESEWNTPLAKYSSADYCVNNMLSPVLFYDVLKFIPENAILIEFGPHALLQPLLKRSLPKTVTNIGLLKRNHPDNVSFLLSNIGRIYNAGRQPRISALYPKISLPVGRGTPMLCDMVKWDHSKEWTVADFTSKRAGSGELSVDVDISKEEFQYLAGHSVDGRTLFPATGYMILVWKTLARLRNADYEQLPIILEDIKFLRATIMPKNGSVKFYINIFEGSGEFEICESGSVAVSGKVYVPKNIEGEFLSPYTPDSPKDQNAPPLIKEEIYKEFHLRGYDYDGHFRGIEKSDNYGLKGVLRWENNWITFIDTALQFSMLQQPIRELYLPRRLHKVIINPKTHASLAKEVSVHAYPFIGVIKAGGVEIRGLKGGVAPRRQHTQAPPKLEKYQFVPLENRNSLTEDSEKSNYDALTVASQIVSENSSGALKIKIVEVVGEDHILILPKVQEIFETEPTFEIEAVIVTSKPIDETLITEKPTKVSQKNITSGAFEQNAHLVILVDVLAKSQDKLLVNAVSSLKPGGFILFKEPKGHAKTQLLTSHSFGVIYQQVTATNLYLLARRSEAIPQEQIVVRITEQNYDWVEPLKQALQTSEAKGTRVYLLCQGETATGLVGMMTCVKQEPGGLNVRSIFIQDDNFEPFSLTSNYYKNQLKKNLVQNVLKNGVWGTYRHLLLEQTKEQSQVEHAYVNTLRRGDLSSLKWIEGPLKYYSGAATDTELCTIYYASLNFRDTMLASGKLNVEALPDYFARQECILGSEFSGRDSKGRRIMSMAKGRSLATSISVDPSYLWEVPDEWSLEEAATIPIVYGTCYYALIMRGNIQPGESILVHAGSGGVGLASISIAYHIGCKVFATVSSQAKRDFLKASYPQLTDDCIGYSRDTSFEQMVMVQTKGRGVNVVLNCLSEEHLRASVRCLAIGGRFLEIGKTDVANDSALGMAAFLGNTTFHGVFLDTVFAFELAERKEVHRLVKEGIANGVVRPLPTTVFEKDQVEQAFRFMASGKHVGKILVKIRDEERCRTDLPVYKTVSAIPKTYMDPEKVYVLVGGLGGFGLELTHWLISRGAKKIVLSSRSGIKSGYQYLCVRRWRSENVIVNVSTADVTTDDGARCLLEEAKKLGFIGGIFNLAAVLVDALMDNQSETNFKAVCKPKIDATKHLDSASRLLAPILDHFVVFSSVACGRGNAGQVNYGYANSAMERICEERQVAGLPAIAIQWGAIGDVGLVVETLKGATEVGGTLLQNMSSCLSTMDILLRQPQPVVSSMVLAEKRKGTKDSNQVKLTNAVAHILGITDVNSIATESSLSDLGMDSLMGTEIKQTLERNYDVVLNAQEIRGLTFSKLFAMEDGTNSRSAQGNIDQNQMAQFANQLVPTIVIVKIPRQETTDTKQPPVFFLSPIEGVVTNLKPLARNIQAPVYGLQCTSSAPLDSITNLAKYYITHIKSIQKKGPYTLIGYSFGACVGFEVGLQLEAMNEKVRILFIDGSPSYLLALNEKVKTVKLNNTAYTQSRLMLFFIIQFKEVADDEKLISELMSLGSWEERLKKCIQIVRSVTSLPADQISAAASAYYHKLLAAYEYKPIAKFKGEGFLVKATDNTFHLDLEDDYGLNSICTEKITMKTLEGSHATVIQNPELCEITTKFCNEVCI